MEAAIQRYGSATYKAPAATVLDPNGKLSINLTYGTTLTFLSLVSRILLFDCLELNLLHSPIMMWKTTLNDIYMGKIKES